MKTEQSVSDNLNQCDGCARGLSMVQGIHHDESGAYMCCTAGRYVCPDKDPDSAPVIKTE